MHRHARPPQQFCDAPACTVVTERGNEGDIGATPGREERGQRRAAGPVSHFDLAHNWHRGVGGEAARVPIDIHIEEGIARHHDVHEITLATGAPRYVRSSSSTASHTRWTAT